MPPVTRSSKAGYPLALTLICLLLLTTLLSRVFAQTEPTGTLVVAHYQEPASLDPTLTTRRVDLGIIRLLVFDPLVGRDANGAFIPMLATDWRQISDTVWEFDLREGVTFHDGTPFDARSVEFTINKLLDPNTTQVQGFLWDGISHVEIVDDYQVRIHTAEPFGPLLAHLALGAMLPPHWDQEVNSRSPIGTGPFRFVEWSRGNRIVVEAVEDHWDGPPGVNRVEVVPIREDATRIAAVQSGDIHIAHPVPVQLVAPLERLPGIGIARVISPITQHLSLGGNARPPVGGDPLVLQAIDLAINRQALLDTVFLGQGEMPTSIFAPTIDFAHPDLPEKEYDPERARELLAEAGYPDGFEAELWYTAGGELQIAEAVVAVVQQLAEVGINVNVRVAPDTGVGAPILNAGNFDMFYNGWASYPLDPDFYVWGNFHPEGRNREGTGDKYEFSAEVTELIERGRYSTDEDERRDAYYRLQEILWENPTRLPTVQPYDLYAVRDEVEGFEPRPDQMWLSLRKVTLGDGR